MAPFVENSGLDSLIDWLISLLAHQAVLAPVLLLIIEEAGVPLPVPGDVVVAYTGYNVSRGLVSYPAALISILVAIFIGSSILYYLSYRFGNLLLSKFGKYIHLHPERVATVEEKFNKYGPLVIIIGRHIPGFRIPITIFSGISKVSYKTFILSTLASTIIWAVFYLNLGARLGPRVTHLLRVSSHTFVLILVSLLLTLLVMVIAFRLTGLGKRK